MVRCGSPAFFETAPQSSPDFFCWEALRGVPIRPKTIAMAEPKDLIGSGHRILRWQSAKELQFVSQTKHFWKCKTTLNWWKWWNNDFFTIDLESSNCHNDFWWVAENTCNEAKLQCWCTKACLLRNRGVGTEARLRACRPRNDKELDSEALLGIRNNKSSRWMLRVPTCHLPGGASMGGVSQEARRKKPACQNRVVKWLMWMPNGKGP